MGSIPLSTPLLSPLACPGLRASLAQKLWQADRSRTGVVHWKSPGASTCARMPTRCDQNARDTSHYGGISRLPHGKQVQVCPGVETWRRIGVSCIDALIPSRAVPGHSQVSRTANRSNCSGERRAHPASESYCLAASLSIPRTLFDRESFSFPHLHPFESKLAKTGREETKFGFDQGHCCQPVQTLFSVDVSFGTVSRSRRMRHEMRKYKQEA